MSAGKEKSSYDMIREELEDLTEESVPELEPERDFTFENTEFAVEDLDSDY